MFAQMFSIRINVSPPNYKLIITLNLNNAPMIKLGPKGNYILIVFRSIGP